MVTGSLAIHGAGVVSRGPTRGRDWPDEAGRSGARGSATLTPPGLGGRDRPQDSKGQPYLLSEFHFLLYVFMDRTIISIDNLDGPSKTKTETNVR